MQEKKKHNIFFGQILVFWECLPVPPAGGGGGDGGGQADEELTPAGGPVLGDLVAAVAVAGPPVGVTAQPS